MTEFLKDKFSSRPGSKAYRQGWDRTFRKKVWICEECGGQCAGGHNCPVCGEASDLSSIIPTLPTGICVGCSSPTHDESYSWCHQCARIRATTE